MIIIVDCTTSSSFLRMFNVCDARDFRVQIIKKGSGLRTSRDTEHLQTFENNDTIYYFKWSVVASLPFSPTWSPSSSFITTVRSKRKRGTMLLRNLFDVWSCMNLVLDFPSNAEFNAMLHLTTTECDNTSVAPVTIVTRTDKIVILQLSILCRKLRNLPKFRHIH